MTGGAPGSISTSKAFGMFLGRRIGAPTLWGALSGRLLLHLSRRRSTKPVAPSKAPSRWGLTWQGIRLRQTSRLGRTPWSAWTKDHRGPDDLGSRACFTANATASGVRGLVAEFGATLRPMHPGISDKYLRTFYDVEVPRDWADGLVEALRKRPDVAAAYVKPDGALP